MVRISAQREAIPTEVVPPLRDRRPRAIRRALPDRCWRLRRRRQLAIKIGTDGILNPMRPPRSFHDDGWNLPPSTVRVGNSRRKRGFVFGISQYLSAVAQPDEEPPFPVRGAYQRRLAGPTDAILARHLEGYVARNPPSPKEPMIRVALRAMFDFCRSEIEKTQPSQARPAR